MAGLAFPEVRRSQAGGVHVFWADAPPPHEVQPQLWRRGGKPTELVDELAPPDLVIDMGDDAPPPLF